MAISTILTISGCIYQAAASLVLEENGAGGRVGGSAGNGAAPMVNGTAPMVDGSAAVGEAVAVSVVPEAAGPGDAGSKEAAAGGAVPKEGGAVSLVLSMKALLRAIKDEQGKSRGTRDVLQRSMLC